MVKKFTAKCKFSGQESPVTLYVGNPAPGTHPLGAQSKWIGGRGGTIPSEIMDSFSKLTSIAEKNKLPFEDLCDYVIKEIQAGSSLASDAKEATSISESSSSSTKPDDKK
jgi:hypothetical protein